MEETSRLGWDTLMLYIQNTGKLPDVVAVPNPEGEDKWPLALTPVIAFGQMWEYIQSEDNDTQIAELEQHLANSRVDCVRLEDQLHSLNQDYISVCNQNTELTQQLNLLTPEVDDSI